MSTGRGWPGPVGSNVTVLRVAAGNGDRPLPIRRESARRCHPRDARAASRPTFATRPRSSVRGFAGIFKQDELTVRRNILGNIPVVPGEIHILFAAQSAECQAPGAWSSRPPGRGRRRAMSCRVIPMGRSSTVRTLPDEGDRHQIQVGAFLDRGEPDFLPRPGATRRPARIPIPRESAGPCPARSTTQTTPTIVPERRDDP